MVAHNMHLRRPPSKATSIPPTGLKIWSEELGPAPAQSSSSDDKLDWRQKQRRIVIGANGEVVHSIGYYLFAAVGAWSGLLLLFLLWWQPHLYTTGGVTGAAFFVGILLSYMYHYNVRKKEQYQQVVSGLCTLQLCVHKASYIFVFFGGGGGVGEGNRM